MIIYHNMVNCLDFHSWNDPESSKTGRLTHESCRYGCEEKFLTPDRDSVLQILHLSDEILQLKHLLE